jgi:uncharacterized protein YebE (UPF0316 family)
VILLPVLICVAETAVVALDTVRTIFIARGVKTLATVLGLLEATIWLFAISQVMQNLTQASCFVGYAAGFTIGTYLGMRIEEKLAIGTQVVRIITVREATALIAALRRAGYGVTSIGADGATGGVHVLFTIVERKLIQCVVNIIEQFDPQTFYVIEDVRIANRGVFPTRSKKSDRSRPSTAPYKIPA